MNKLEAGKKHRCDGCEYVESIKTGIGGYKFSACLKSPYRGKAVWEIKTCPIGKGTIDIPTYLKQD